MLKSLSTRVFVPVRSTLAGKLADNSLGLVCLQHDNMNYCCSSLPDLRYISHISSFSRKMHVSVLR